MQDIVSYLRNNEKAQWANELHRNILMSQVDKNALVILTWNNSSMFSLWKKKHLTKKQFRKG